MADEGTYLQQLADYCGIESEFTDGQGRCCKVSEATQRQLLRALGFNAASEEAARRSLDQLQLNEWQRPLLPVRVLYSCASMDVEVVLPQDTEDVVWCVELEGGGKLRGSIAFAQLALIAARTVDGRVLERRRLILDGELKPGYHRLSIEPTSAMMLLIVTPGQCWLPADRSEGRRLWGVSAQLYLVRSERNWGIGDYTDLAELMSLVDRSGGDVVGVNPLHAMFLDNPEHCSPYSPASRLLLNALNIDVTAIAGFTDAHAVQTIVNSAEFCNELAECQRAHYVEYRRVADLKIPVLRALFEHHRLGAGKHWAEFQNYRSSRDELFDRACIFLALRQFFTMRETEQGDWQRWPEPYQDCHSDAVAQFAHAQADEVSWFAWLEWIAQQQLSKAIVASTGMQVGLYRDLAVGADERGAEVWSHPEVFVPGAHVGAPPDLFNAEGQDWGLPAFHPRVLRESGYNAFIALLRANMRHAGALRIDHVMALKHLFLIPEGEVAANGAYVRYPFEDLIGILALESQRHRCIAVGEDLGSVPEGFRGRMAQANVLSYRVLTFEKDEKGCFVPPQSYPTLALAVFANHDLPTLRGWWEEADIDLKVRMNGFAKEEDVGVARIERRRDRKRLSDALREEHLLDGDQQPAFEELLPAVHAYLGRTRALLAIAQLDDIGAERDPVNVPGDSGSYPNWRRRLALSIKEFADSPAFGPVAVAMQSGARPCSRQ